MLLLNKCEDQASTASQNPVQHDALCYKEHYRLKLVEPAKYYLSLLKVQSSSYRTTPPPIIHNPNEAREFIR